jgi:hypothetical protein
MKVEHQIVHHSIYVTRFIEMWQNFNFFGLNYGYWKSFHALVLSWFNFEVLKYFWLYVYG